MISGEQISQVLAAHCPNLQLGQAIRQRAWVEISEGALRRNVQAIRQRLSPKTALMAVVKADAYGHGAVRVAETVLQAGAQWLAIATLGEGVELREAGITAPILVLGAINTAAEVEALARWQLQPTLCNPQQALLFSQTLGDRRESLPVHLKIDTGMSRLGTPWTEAQSFIHWVHQLPQLTIASIYSHFATADDPDPRIMEEQHRRFLEVIQTLPPGVVPQLHIANSAATLCDRLYHHDLVRVGLSLYGLYPAPHLRDRLPLQPALQVKARITQVKTIPPGTGVSYGHRFVSDRTMQIAVVGIGYADGVPRNLSNQLEVLIQGQRVRQLGAITMDQIMIDVSSLSQVQTGDEVTLIGRQGNQQISAEDWADRLNTISWEILCGFKHRLPRVMVP